MLFALGFVFMFTLGGLSGVVLANASLDIAFHDIKKIFFYCSFIVMLPLVFGNNYQITNVKNSNEYLKMFWVGLMDGNGNIQVNCFKKKHLQYRLVIKLSNDKFNCEMLRNIAKVIGGTVRILKKEKNAVIWVLDNKNIIFNIIKTFERYPPLTSRLQSQLNLLYVCLLDDSIELYFRERRLKYNNRLNIIKYFKCNGFITPSYFPCWLSGFIEAKGCFSIRSRNNNSFSIGQNGDSYLLDAIKQFFSSSNQVKNPRQDLYFLEIYKKETLLKIINHCIDYPLLGEKCKSLEKFMAVF